MRYFKNIWQSNECPSPPQRTRVKQTDNFANFFFFSTVRSEHGPATSQHEAQPGHGPRHRQVGDVSQEQTAGKFLHLLSLSIIEIFFLEEN